VQNLPLFSHWLASFKVISSANDDVPTALIQIEAFKLVTS